MALLKSLLVPTDFSAPAAAALDYAVELAEATGAKIYLMHAFQLPIVGFPDGAMVASAELASRITDAAQKSLADAASALAGRKVEIVTLLEQGDPRELVLAKAVDLGVDMIVMGTHGRRGIARALIGSVTEGIVRTAPVPVLTVHERPPR